MDILSAPQAKVKATRMFYFDLVSLPFASASAASRKKAVEKLQRGWVHSLNFKIL